MLPKSFLLHKTVLENTILFFGAFRKGNVTPLTRCDLLKITVAHFWSVQGEYLCMVLTLELELTPKTSDKARLVPILWMLP